MANSTDFFFLHHFVFFFFVEGVSVLEVGKKKGVLKRTAFSRFGRNRKWSLFLGFFKFSFSFFSNRIVFVGNCLCIGCIFFFNSLFLFFF